MAHLSLILLALHVRQQPRQTSCSEKSVGILLVFVDSPLGQLYFYLCVHCSCCLSVLKGSIFLWIGVFPDTGALSLRPDKGKTSTALTTEKWQELVDTLRSWGPKDESGEYIPLNAIEDIEQRDAVSSFRRENKSGHYLAKNFTVETYIKEDEVAFRLRRKESSGKNRIVVPIDQVFKVIYEAHLKTGHGGMDNTYAELSNDFHNITQNQVKIFKKLCPSCNRQNVAIRTLPGAARPVVSDEFRQRFQVDLIDMRSNPQKNIHGTEMRWILTCKDHFMGFTALDSLPKKEAVFVAHSLNYILGIIGCSKVFHTDNGTEFIAKEVIEMLKRINPNIAPVTGRPRKPSDQGSVERQNQWVKKVKKSLEDEGRIAGGETNWVLLLPRVMGSLNSCKGTKSRKAASAYETVFGMPYHFPVIGSLEEMRNCNTVGDLVKLGGASEAFLAEEYDSSEDPESDSKPAAKEDGPDNDIPVPHLPDTKMTDPSGADFDSKPAAKYDPPVDDLPRYDADQLVARVRKKARYILDPSTNMRRFDWENFSRQACICFNALPPDVNFLHGPLELDIDDDTAGVSADTAQENTPRTSRRLLASEFRKERQMNQATKMITRRQKAMGDEGVGPGAIVHVGNDRRDIPDARSSIGVVFDMKEAGGVRVCTEYGVLVTGQKRSDFWIPSDRYRVVAGINHEGSIAVHGLGLDSIREAVLNGTFDVANYDGLTLGEDQKRYIGQTPLKRSRGCKCGVRSGKKGCSKQCICIRDGVPCNSSCLCMGNCTENKYN
jgi:hypothetical protein